MEKWKKKKVCQAEWYSPCEEAQAVCVKRKGGKCVWHHIADEPCLLDEEEKQMYGRTFMYKDYVNFYSYMHVILL